MREQDRRPSLKRLFSIFLAAQKYGPRRGGRGPQQMRAEVSANRYFRYNARFRPARRAANACASLCLSLLPLYHSVSARKAGNICVRWSQRIVSSAVSLGFVFAEQKQGSLRRGGQGRRLMCMPVWGRKRMMRDKEKTGAIF